MIPEIEKKYFKMAVGPNVKEMATDISVSCPICEKFKDNKTLHMYVNKGLDQPLVRCFRGACEANEHRSLGNFLKDFYPNLARQYKSEKFKKDIQSIKSGNLNDILSRVNAKENTPTEKVIAIEKVIIPKVENIDRKVPEYFTKKFYNAKDISKCKSYLAGRSIPVGDDWLFSNRKFVEFEGLFDKPKHLPDSLLIPLWWENKLQGFYTRSIVEKEFNTIIFPQKIKIWTSEGYDNTKVTIITEGIFDAMSSGFESACAMLSSDIPEEVLEDLEDPIFALDLDKAGREKSLKYLKLGYRVFIFPEMWSEYKDLNEVLKYFTPPEIKAVIDRNIYRGKEAIIRLTMLQL